MAEDHRNAFVSSSTQGEKPSSGVQKITSANGPRFITDSGAEIVFEETSGDKIVVILPAVTRQP